MRLYDGMRAAHAGRSPWRWFPWIVAAGMATVVAVNATMIFAALHTFPGKAGHDGFDLSNRYNAVIADVEQQAALGWTLDARAAADGRPFVALADHSGAPLTGAHLEAVAERPLGAAHSIALAFREQAPGRYVADLPLGLPGQWDLSLTANAGGHEVVTTRRVVVR